MDDELDLLVFYGPDENRIDCVVSPYMGIAMMAKGYSLPRSKRDEKEGQGMRRNAAARLPPDIFTVFPYWAGG